MVYGALIAIVTMIGYYIGLEESAKSATTMAFATLTLARLFHGFNLRSEKSIFKIGFMSNKWSIGAFILGVLLLALVLFAPFMHKLFVIDPLNGSQALSILILAFIPTAVIQVVRLFKKD